MCAVPCVWLQVLDAGRIHEYDEPYVLLQDREGIFYKMVQQTGKTEAAALLHSAKQVTTPHTRVTAHVPRCFSARLCFCLLCLKLFHKKLPWLFLALSLLQTKKLSVHISRLLFICSSQLLEYSTIAFLSMKLVSIQNLVPSLGYLFISEDIHLISPLKI